MRRTQQELSQLWTAVRERLVVEDGQALIEYALILGLVSVVAIAALKTA